jgi:hypothetical protein
VPKRLTACQSKRKKRRDVWPQQLKCFRMYVDVHHVSYSIRTVITMFEQGLGKCAVARNSAPIDQEDSSDMSHDGWRSSRRLEFCSYASRTSCSSVLPNRNPILERELLLWPLVQKISYPQQNSGPVVACPRDRFGICSDGKF